MKKEKRELFFKGHPITEYTPILFFFSIIAAIGIIGNAIGEANFWEGLAITYLLIAFFVYYYSNAEDKRHADYKIAELKKENERLKDKLKLFEAQPNN